MDSKQPTPYAYWTWATTTLRFAPPTLARLQGLWPLTVAHGNSTVGPDGDAHNFCVALCNDFQRADFYLRPEFVEYGRADITLPLIWARAGEVHVQLTAHSTPQTVRGTDELCTLLLPEFQNWGLHLAQYLAEDSVEPLSRIVTRGCSKLYVNREHPGYIDALGDIRPPAPQAVDYPDGLQDTTEVRRARALMNIHLRPGLKPVYSDFQFVVTDLDLELLTAQGMVTKTHGRPKWFAVGEPVVIRWVRDCTWRMTSPQDQDTVRGGQPLWLDPEQGILVGS